MSTKITKSQLKEHIAKLVAEQVKSLSPEAQKALELSRQAKLNKDAQKKRAAAKNSMRGISVEGVEPIEEQSSSTRNPKLQRFYDAVEISKKTGSSINHLSSNAKEQIMSLLNGIEFKNGFVEDLVWGIMQPENYIYGYDAIMSTGKTEPLEDLIFLGKRQLGEQSSWHRNEKGELADLYKTKYRVNFGQGQVSNTFPTKKEAEYEMTFIDEPGAFIQFKDLNTGEWFNIKHLREQRRVEGDKLHSDEADFFDTSELEDYQDDLNNDYLGFDDDGDIGDSYRGADESSWDDGYMHGSYRYVPEATNQYEFDEFDSYDEEEEKAEIERVGLARYEKNLDDLDRERMNNRKK